MQQQMQVATRIMATIPPTPTTNPKKVTSKSPILKALLSNHLPAGTTSLSQFLASLPASEASSIAVGTFFSWSAVAVATH